jgi:hypothetical protein
MILYRVSISGFQGAYTERWEANSREEAEQKARRRWQRDFGDAGAYRFFASPITTVPGHDDDDEETDR